MLKTILYTFQLFFLSTVLISAFAQQTPDSGKNEKNNITVLVKYKSLPDKHNDAFSTLNTLILEVKKEPHFVNIKLLVDPADKTNILLYEEWSDEVYYKGEHMNTPHLQKFIGDSRNILAGPPEITFWELKSNYTTD